MPVIENLDLLPLGEPDAMPATLDTGLVTGGCDRYDTIIIDTGTRPVTGCDTAATMLLVTRPCYLALRRAADTPLRPCGVVLINEPGRALTATDIEAVLGRPILATVPYDPAISRAVDSGLLTTRVPPHHPSPPHARPSTAPSRPDPHPYPDPMTAMPGLPIDAETETITIVRGYTPGAASPPARQCLCPLDR